MFIGHYALAFAARKKERGPSLAVLFIAVQFLDLIWPLFVLAGIESFAIEPGNTALTPLHFSHYPWSHSLLMAVVWGALFGLVYFLYTKERRSALLLGALVVSHWVIDFLVHAPDLPLTPFGDAKFGLGLWDMPAVAIPIELALFIGGVCLYYRAVRPERKKLFFGLIILFLVIHLANTFGPPPPSVMAVAWSANLMWLFILWAWWMERRPSQSAQG